VEHLGGVDLRVVASRAAETGEPTDVPGVPVRLVPNDPRGGRKATLALNASAAAVALRHRPDVVLAMHVRAMPVARLAALSVGSRTVVVVHAKEMGEQPGLARAAMRWADRVVAVSGYARDLALDAGAPPDRIRIVHPGVTPPTESAPAPSSRPGPPTIVTVSRLDDRYQGHDVVLEALPSLRAAIPDVRWVVVGSGGLVVELRARARDLGVAGAVDFRGNLGDAERDTALRSAHVFCMPSRRPEHGIGEGFGIVYLEAGAQRLPVVAGAVPGVVDAVRDGESGLLVDPADPAAVSAALVRILRDPALMDRLGDGGVAHASELTWTRVAARYGELLAEVADGGRTARRAADRRWLRDLLAGPG
jgi:phosphatidylinositol alpha-1,6-mannosyltransferase